ncbi:MAG: glutamine synthetase family protein [Corynebacterium sp.]|nr:glutamine synthetase family protein [Corynebacterium sp.]
MESAHEFVLRTLEEQDIRYIRLWFTDIWGYLKSVVVVPEEIEGAFETGIGFDGSSIEGYSRISEADTLARPDPSTFQLVPFDEYVGGGATARMFCDITTPEGKPSWVDPRQLLRRQMEKAEEQGFSFHVHPEVEFFLVNSVNTQGQPPEPTDYGGYFDQSTADQAPTFRREMMGALEQMGISVEFAHHEAAPGQQEIDLRHTDGLTMADNIMTLRYLVKQVAHRNGVDATFMPKPFAHYAGSGLHSHLSLFEGDYNAFHDPDDPNHLSATGKQFIAGILHHAGEISAVTNQWVNSYKRLMFGDEAPTAATWGVANRSALVRLPGYSVEKASSRRIEVRSLDSACNPYLAYAVLLAAGLKGIAEGYELVDPAEDDISSLTRRERRALGYVDLPRSLDQALRAMEASELVAETLGEHVFEFFLQTKWNEIRDYEAQVTPWELQQGLGY